MFNIKKKLIKFYLDNKTNYIYTKSKSSIITKDILGKTVYVYNGRVWLKKAIDNSSYVYKPIGSLKRWCQKS